MAAKKKYQVFISSTYLDMKDERQAAVEAILTAGHIPAGMELFSAGDESQLEVIKRWIRESDIYLLLLGARYGSIEPREQLSYSEVEYDYAVSLNKPHFALVLSDEALKTRSAVLEADGVERDNLEKLDTFREKVLSKVSRFFDDSKDVKIYIPESIRGLEDRHGPALIGWVKGDETVDSAPLVGEVSRLTVQNQDLQKQLHHALAQIPRTPPGPPLAGLDDSFALTINYKSSYNSQPYTRSVSTTWRKLFALISPKIVEHPNDEFLRSYIAQEVMKADGKDVYSPKLDEQTHSTVRIQLELLGLITTEYAQSVDKRMRIFWHLTESGEHLMLELRAVRKESQIGPQSSL